MAKKKLDRSIMVPVRLSKVLVKDIDMICLERDCYRSEVIREALNDYIRRNKALKTVG